MQTAALYIRVSTDDQVEYSPDAQRKALIKYAKDNNMYVDEKHIYVDEGISGRKAEKRPAFMNMIAQAKRKPKPFDVILVHKFDRFARNREDSVVYKSLLRKDCDVKVISITESIEDDKFSIILESMLEAMAEYYSLNLADEVKKGMFEKADRGEHIGSVPYGYELKEKQLIPHPTEFKVAEKIFDMFVNQNASLLEIARYLNNQGIKTKKGKEWIKQPLRYLLRNHVYAGYVRYNYRNPKTNKINPESEWILTKSNHTPVVSDEIFEQAQEILQKRSILRRTETDPNVLKHWLQKLVKCKYCGSTMRILHVTRNGIRYNYFRCDRAYQGGCNISNTFSARKLSMLVVNKIANDLSTGNIKISKVKSTQQMSELDNLNNRLKKIQRQYELVYKSYIAEIDSLEEYKNNKAILAKEEAEIVSLIEDLKKNNNTNIIKPIVIQNFLELMDNKDLSENDKNKAARQFIDRIDVDLVNKKVDVKYYM